MPSTLDPLPKYNGPEKDSNPLKTLEIAISAIQNARALPPPEYSYDALHNRAYQLVNKNKGSEVVALAQKLIAAHLKKVVHLLKPGAGGPNGTSSSTTGSRSGKAGSSPMKRSSSSRSSSTRHSSTPPTPAPPGSPSAPPPPGSTGVGATSSNDGVFELLPHLNSSWDMHKTVMLMIRDVLLYVDRVYVPSARKTPIYDNGLHLWTSVVLHDEWVKERFRMEILNSIARERAGELVNRPLLKSMTQMLLDCGTGTAKVYEDELEGPFLVSTQEFYAAESQALLGTVSCADYLKKAEARMFEEDERVTNYLNEPTRGQLKSLMEATLVSNHMVALAEMGQSGLVALLESDKIEDLARMYKLFGLVAGGHKLIMDQMSAHVKSVGEAIVIVPPADKPDPLAIVQKLIDLEEKYKVLIDKAYRGDKDFAQALAIAMEWVVNKNKNSPEYISLFVDEKLKKGFKGVSEAEVEALLDRAIRLFRHISEKDVFEKYYKAHLAKRLLGGKSASDDAERTMLTKLKAECGYQFTSKLEGMFKDMQLSEETMNGWEHYLQRVASSAAVAPVELTVKVLTTGFWPTQSGDLGELPDGVKTSADAFKKWYLGSRSGRKLTWQFGLGTADVRAHFTATSRKELIVATYQMIVLAQFNKNDEMTFGELVKSTQLPTDDCRRAALSLSVGKYQILTKEPKSKTCAEGDKFSVNTGFKAKLVRIRIPMISSKENVKKERDDVKAKVDEGRKHMVEAAIVRIMKSRKTLDHANLVVEVTKQLQTRFTPTPQLIKVRIESLIEREYLQRQAEKRGVYEYLA